MLKNKRIHSFRDDVLEHHDAVALASLIKNKVISQVEVIRASIDRANKIKAPINPIVFENYEEAIVQAAKEIKGSFAGVPIFMKDLTLVKGIPTYFGSDAFIGAPPATTTDKIAHQIFSMGFINMGTSSLPEFGLTCSTEFPDRNNTLNPWNSDYSAGGSSGGSAALVAAGVVPIAHAADGGGSTRIPAACCGLIGLKPTRDRILLSSAFEKPLVKISIDGVLSRSVRDTAHFYYEAEKYYHNQTLPQIGLVNAPLKKKLNIGYIEEALNDSTIDQPVKRVFNETLKMLEDLGHSLQPVKWPITDEMRQDFKMLWAANGFIINRFGKLLFKKPYDSSKLTLLTKGLSRFYAKNFWRRPLFIRRLKRLSAHYESFMETNQIDIILTPTVAQLTPPIGHLGMHLPYETIMERMGFWARYTAYANANGSPSISLPLGHDDEHDLPIGMLFGAKYGQDRLLIELSLQLEQYRPWKKIF
jgi:amidase